MRVRRGRDSKKVYPISNCQLVESDSIIQFSYQMNYIRFRLQILETIQFSHSGSKVFNLFLMFLKGILFFVQIKALIIKYE